MLELGSRGNINRIVTHAVSPNRHESGRGFHDLPRDLGVSHDERIAIADGGQNAGSILRLRIHELCLLRQQIFAGWVDVFDEENFHRNLSIRNGLESVRVTECQRH